MTTTAIANPPRDARISRVVSNVAAALLILVSTAVAIAFILDAHTKLTAAGQPPVVDWRTYARAAERFLSGDSIYSLRQLQGEYLMPETVSIGYSYPPPSVLLFVPFQSVPVGLAAWLMLNAALLVSGIAAILRTDLGMRWPWALGWSALSVAVFYPFANGMAVGNVNVGLAGLMAWYWVAGQGRWTGPAGGIGGILKIFPGFFTLFAARQRGVRPVAEAVAIGVAVTLVTLPVVSIASWTDYAKVLSNQTATCWDTTISVACVLQPSVGPEAAKTIGIVLGLVFAVGVLLVRSRYLAFGCLTAAVLAPVTDGWPHYWLFVYVAIFAGIGNFAVRRRAQLRGSAPGIRESD